MQRWQIKGLSQILAVRNRLHRLVLLQRMLGGGEVRQGYTLLRTKYFKGYGDNATVANR